MELFVEADSSSGYAQLYPNFTNDYLIFLVGHVADVTLFAIRALPIGTTVWIQTFLHKTCIEFVRMAVVMILVFTL